MSHGWVLMKNQALTVWQAVCKYQRDPKKEVNMKNRVARLLSVGIALAAVAAVHAQDKTVKANVPFTFYMGSSLMPQGAYRVSEISNGALVRIVSVKTGAAQGAATLHVIGKTETEPARLVFHRYGEDYFLAEIWTG